MESAGEFAWFRGEIVRSLAQPRAFARSLATEHFGVAGVLVALIAGVAFSLTVDSLVLALNGFFPPELLNRIILPALFFGVRLNVSAAIVAVVVYLAVRATRRAELSLDQAFNAVAFALTPLFLAPIAGVIVSVAAGLLPIAGVVVALVVARTLAGLILNFRAILPPALAVVALALVLGASALVLTDQLTRAGMTAYAIAPQLAAPIDAPPAAGKRYDFGGATLTVPESWAHSVRGIPGEVAHFETPTATLNVLRSQPEPLATMDSFASQLARSERLGFQARRDDRSVRRIDGMVVVDDRAEGTYEARRVAIRQFTFVKQSTGMALQFRFFDPSDVDAVFAEAASIAATWRVGS